MMKTIILILTVLTLSLSAGIIEYQDDDQHQFIEFGSCDDSTSQIILYVALIPDSGWAIIDTVSLSDTVYTVIFNYIAPDRDENDRLIPGTYQGEYWYHTESIMLNGDAVLSADTIHQTVDYTIGGGCVGTHHVD